MNINTKLLISVTYFLFLYIVAWISARGYREDNAVLGVTKHQWKALFVMWTPVLTLFL